MAQIGTVGVSQRLETQPTPNIDASRFGAGVGEALRNFAGSMDQYQQSLSGVQDSQATLEAQYAERQRRLARANAEVALVRLNAEIDRDVTTMKDSADPTGAGFTESVTTYTNQRVDEFLGTLPEELRPEFAGRLEGVRQSAINTGFAHQITLEDSAFKTNLADVAQQAVDSISAGRGTSADWLPTLEQLAQNSPLDDAETAALMDTVVRAVQSADMKAEAQRIALDPSAGAGTTGGPADGSDIVAAGMPGVARGMLNVIAGVESPGYDRMYGGSSFSGYADHPRKVNCTPDGVCSTAAGRYQFLASTWDEAAAALGLTDFSPESQDRAAWWLAQRDYKEKTGGRDLALDLSSGDFALVAQARKVLGGSGASTTWQGLQNMSDEEFFRQVTGQTGTPSALMNDPRYADLSYDERLAIVSDAEKLATNLRAEAVAREQAQREAARNALRFAIEAGTAGMADIVKGAQDNQWSFEETQQLWTQFNKKNEEQLAAMTFSNNFAAPGFNPSSEESKKGYNNLFAMEGAQALAAQDANYVNSRLMPMAQKMGALPKQAVEQLTAQLRSANPAESAFARQTLTTLKAVSAPAFAQLPDKLQQDMIFYETAGKYMSPSEMVQLQQFYMDPANSTVIESRKVAAQKLLYSADTGSPEIVALAKDYLGGDFAVTDPLANSMLERDYAALFAEGFMKNPDEQFAQDYALEKLGTRWGVTSAGGSERLMYLAPEKLYPPINASHDYLREIVLEDFQLDPGVKFTLVADARTQSEFSAGKAPSYLVMMVGSDGLPYFARTPGQDENRPGQRGTPARVAFVPSEKMNMALVDEGVRKREASRLFQEEEQVLMELKWARSPAEQERLLSVYNQIQLDVQAVTGRAPIPYSSEFMEQTPEASSLTALFTKEQELERLEKLLLNAKKYPQLFAGMQEKYQAQIDTLRNEVKTMREGLGK